MRIRTWRNGAMAFGAASLLLTLATTTAQAKGDGHNDKDGKSYTPAVIGDIPYRDAQIARFPAVIDRGSVPFAGRTLGQDRVRVDSQSDIGYPENVSYERGRVAFAVPLTEADTARELVRRGLYRVLSRYIVTV
jgi:hypothetical protein